MEELTRYRLPTVELLKTAQRGRIRKGLEESPMSTLGPRTQHGNTTLRVIRSGEKKPLED